MLAGSLEIQMQMSTARILDDVRKVQTTVGGAMGSIEKAVASAQNALGALGIGVGAGYFVSLIKDSIDAADHLNDLSKTTAISVEQLAGLKLAAKQTGGDLDSIAASISKLSVNMGKDAEKFKALGVSAKDPLEAFKQLSDVFKNIVDPQQRAAVMAAALGKSWAGAAPLLAEGSKNIQEMVDKGAKLSGMTKEMAEASDNFNDKVAELGTSIGATKNQIASGLLPTLTALVDNFTLVRNIIASVVAAKIASWAAQAAAALYATVSANMAKAAATLAAANADVVATGAAVALTTSRVAELRAAVLAAEGEAILAVTMNGLIPMQAKAATAAAAHAVALDAQAVAQRAASVSAGLASGALGLLGGPIGWITLLLGLGATAWALWGKNSKDATEQAKDSVARGLEIVQRLNKEAKFGTGDIGNLNIALDAAKGRIADLKAKGISVDSSSFKTAQINAFMLEAAIDQLKTKIVVLTEAEIKQAAAAKKFLEDQKTATDAYAKIQDSADKYVATLLKEADQLGMTDKQKAMYNMTTVAMTLNAGKERDSFIAVTTVLIEEVDAYKKAVEIAKERAALRQKEADGIDAYMTAQTEGYAAAVKGAQDATAAARTEYDQMGMSKSQIAEITLLKLQEMQVSEKGGIVAVAYREKEIEAIKEQIGWLKKTETKQAGIDTAKKVAEEWKRGWEETDRIAREAFTSWADGGKNAADVIGAALKKALLSAIYEATIRPIALNIYTSLTGGPGGSSGSMLGNVAGLNSLYNIANGPMSVAGMTNSFAQTQMGQNMGLWSNTANNPSAVGGHLSSTGESLSSGMNTALSVLGYADAFSAAAGGRWGEAAGEAIGTYIMPGVGTLIGKMIGSAIDSAFAGEMRAGGQYTYNSATGTAFEQGPSGGQIMSADVQKAITATVGTINNLLTGIGSAARLSGFQAGLESSTAGRGGVFAGGTFTSGATFGESGNGSNYNGTLFESTSTQSPDAQTAMANFATDLTQATLQALQAATDIPKTISDMLKGQDIEALSSQAATDLLNTIDAVVTTVVNFNAAAKTLPFEYLKNLSFDTAAGLIAAAGGMDKLGANLATYYDKFYSPLEKTALLTKNTTAAFASLGIVMPAVNDEMRVWYRSEVERLGGMDLSIAANATAYTGVLALAGAVDTLSPAADAAAVAVRSAADILNEHTRLQNEYDNLTMTAAELLGKQRDALDSSNQSLFDQIQVAQAAKDATDALTSAQEDATAAAETLAATNRSWQDQLDIMTGKQTEHEIALRDASDDSTRALMRQVYAMQDASSSMDGFTQTVMGLVDGIHNSVTGSIFQMRYGLQDSAGQYGMLDAQAKQFDDLMKSSTDINLIAKYGQLEIDTINKAFALLDPSQQQSTLDRNVLLLDKIDSFVTGSGADAVSRRRADNAELSAAVAAAVEKALKELAGKMTDAAIAQASAADKVANVVREPANVNVTVSAPRGSEVSVSR